MDGTDGTDGTEGTRGGGTPDAANGQALYDANCTSCHGAGGSGGFAPGITGTSAADLTTGLELATHSSISLTASEIADIAAFLDG